MALPFLYIELWYAKDSWWRLSEDERRSLLGSIDPTCVTGIQRSCWGQL